MTTDTEIEGWVVPGTSRLIVALAIPALVCTALAALELSQAGSPSATPSKPSHVSAVPSGSQKAPGREKALLPER
ncbi:hypothetical protein [Variovorax sp. JS1663]|uniref:hypothetical protein n=1 Tax=Variovorax sp. JS1663 TaxID=1851577 RepID=UPI000B343198|nr:hypothetical protein [Variovorax sp. JS1663]OUL98083.1 hypothetical protein A8M77_33390 [Variovorax sp. JS1663]